VNFLALAPLTADCLPAAVALDQRCLGGLWTLEGYQRELDSPNSDLLILQPESISPDLQQPLIGIACLWAILEEAHITILAIDPAYQRQGLGQALLYALLASAQQRGLEWATLEVRASNRSAITLYQKFGFEEVGKRRNYYQDGLQAEDALILWRKGLQHPEFIQTLNLWQERITEQVRRSGWQLSIAATLKN
jgi:ribosomal-protein-alanine N-acetyltransferase